MQNNDSEMPSAEELKERFGEDVELYAEVRADAAELSGRPNAAKHWDRLSNSLGKEAGGDEQ